MNRAIVMTAFVVLFGASAAAQDTNAQLLQEVRQLREAIEMLVSTGARVQIVFGRLTLQEQRAATAARRLDDLRENLAQATNRATDMAAVVAELDERSRDSRITPEERRNREGELQHMKRPAAQAEAERQRLQREEALAAGALASEQARWAELNQQLEDLERVLSKRP